MASSNNVYVCMSRQSTAAQVTSKNGYPYLKAIRSSENAVRFKGWWIDLDYKGYSSPEETIKALAEFIGATKLPSPLQSYRLAGEYIAIG